MSGESSKSNLDNFANCKLCSWPCAIPTCSKYGRLDSKGDLENRSKLRTSLVLAMNMEITFGITTSASTMFFFNEQTWSRWVSQKPFFCFCPSKSLMHSSLPTFVSSSDPIIETKCLHPVRSCSGHNTHIPWDGEMGRWYSGKVTL